MRQTYFGHTVHGRPLEDQLVLLPPDVMHCIKLCMMASPLYIDIIIIAQTVGVATVGVVNVGVAIMGVG